MVIAGLLSLLLAGTHHASSRGVYRLPVTARIEVGKVYALWSTPNEDVLQHCSVKRLSPEQVRQMFRTYRLVEDVEHEAYSEEGCAIDGKILIRSQTFTFRAQPQNNLYTNWPDGKYKRLGGEPTGEE